METNETRAAVPSEHHLAPATRPDDAIAAGGEIDHVQRPATGEGDRSQTRLRPAGERGCNRGGCDHGPILPSASTIVMWRPPATSGARTRRSSSSPSTPPRT